MSWPNNNMSINRKIMLTYLRMVMMAVLTTLIIGILVSYLYVSTGNDIEYNSVRNLINSPSAYVDIVDGKVKVEEYYITELSKNDIWLQIVNASGECIYQHNVPGDVPSKYSIFELTAYCMQSDQLEGYTMFYLPLNDTEEYGAIIGCSSDKVRKISHKDFNTENNDWLFIAIIFLATATVVVIVSSFLFSKKISRPVADIIEDISEIESGHYSEKEQKNNIFRSVFDKLKSLNNILKQNERMRAEWIANISHDLKTPLSTIQGYAEMIQNTDYESSKEEITMYAAEIQKAEEKMYTLIEDLKMSQKLKEGKVELSKNSTDIVVLIKECVEAIDSNLIGKSQVIFDNTDRIDIDCDREMIKRCLQNIICNAFVHNQKDIVLNIIVIPKGERVQIVIQDNGKGMTEHDISHIFERYYRGTDSQKEKGTGLGLAIAKEIIMAHNGSIEVESIVGEGTKFIIEL